MNLCGVLMGVNLSYFTEINTKLCQALRHFGVKKKIKEGGFVLFLLKDK